MNLRRGGPCEYRRDTIPILSVIDMFIWTDFGAASGNSAAPQWTATPWVMVLTHFLASRYRADDYVRFD